MASRRIVVVTIEGDLHADIVIEKIRALGGRTFRLNLDAYPQAYETSVEFSDNGWCGEIVHRQTGDCLRPQDIGAFWIRKKADFSFSASLTPQERIFAESEMEHLLFGLFTSVDCYWMSRPSAIRQGMWKCEQLSRARQFGFIAPASLASSEAQTVRAFRATHKQIVFKTLSSATLAAEKISADDVIANGLPTTLITDENEELLSYLQEAPGFFQAYVPKKLELRITIIGNRVFTAAIHSQDDPRTAVDFRDYGAEILYEPYALPPAFERQCVEFVKSYGLEFGAIDVIVTPDDEYVFLENNPVGQFYFVEQLAPSLTMTDAMARQLLRESERRAA